MLTLIARRAVVGVAIVWLVATATFVLLAAAPSDVVDAVTGGSPTFPEEVRAHLRHEFCLDRGIIARYGCWIRSIAHGELGYSLSHAQDVSSALAAAIPNTLLLMGLSLAGLTLVGIATGLAQARHPGGAADRAIGAVSMFFYAMPDFWFALIAVFVFAYRLGWLPVSGMKDTVFSLTEGTGARLLDYAKHLVLPVTTFILVGAAGVARYQRAALLDALSQDYVRTARAKGLRERDVLLRHAFRNALLPVITLLGLNLPGLLGGTVLIETVFSWPGMGRLTTGAISDHDYPLVLAAVMAGSALVVIGSLLADLLYAAADPRVRSA